MKRLMLATIATGALMAGVANAAIIDVVTDVFGAGNPVADQIVIGGATANGASGIKYAGSTGAPGSLGGAASITGINHDGRNDRGLGICSEGALCTTPNGGSPEDPEAHIGGVQGDAAEVLRLEKPAGFVWSDIILSSLDKGAGDDDSMFVGWGNNADGSGATTRNFSLAEAGGIDGLSTKFGSIWTALGIDQAAVANSRYLFFFNKTDSIDAVLLNAVGLDPVRAPEPASLALFGAALAGLGVARRRK